jgi:hypothetical protein
VTLRPEKLVRNRGGHRVALWALPRFTSLDVGAGNAITLRVSTRFRHVRSLPGRPAAICPEENIGANRYATADKTAVRPIARTHQVRVLDKAMLTRGTKCLKSLRSSASVCEKCNACLPYVSCIRSTARTARRRRGGVEL